MRATSTGVGTGSGTTDPADTTSFSPSSTSMSSAITSLDGTRRKNPDVGFGVVGRNTATRSFDVRRWISAPRSFRAKRDGEHARVRVRNQHHLPEHAAVALEHRLGDLLRPAVDSVQHGNSRQQLIPGIDKTGARGSST